MTKKTKSTTPDKPQAAQMKAIRNLLEHGQVDEARGRISPLLRAFPDHRPLLALAWEIEDEAGDPMAAATRAFDWVQMSPGSADAHGALSDSAFQAGLVALGAESALKLVAMDGKAAIAVPDVETPFGSMSGAEAVLCDVSRLLLMDGRYDQVVERLANAVHPSLQNNRGIALFSASKVTQALQQFEHSWRQEPSNTFALERIVRLRMWRDGRAAVADLLPALHSNVSERAEDALGKLTGLILLREWDVAEASWQADAPPNPIFDDDARLFGIFAYCGAVVALRSGNMADASDRLRLALQAAPDSPAIIALSQAVRYAGPDDFDVEIGEPGSWFPATWMQRLRNLNWAARDVERQLQQLLEACDAHPDYLGLAVELGGSIAGAIGIKVLTQRAKGGDVPATEQLVSLLTRPCGPDRKRMELLNWLTAERLIGGAAPVQLLANGIVTPVDPAGLAAGSPG